MPRVVPVTYVPGLSVTYVPGLYQPATSAGLNTPTEIFVDAGANLFIADLNNRRVRGVRLGDDQDADGLADREERAIGTDPLNPDTDGDGLSDFQELVVGEDPLVPETVPPTVVLISPPPGATATPGSAGPCAS